MEGIKGTGKDLSNALLGTHEQRMSEEKTIILKMTPGKRPDVVFTGFWSGKFIRAAMDSISKAYRLRRSRLTHPAINRDTKPTAPAVEKKEEVGDGKH